MRFVLSTCCLLLSGDPSPALTKATQLAELWGGARALGRKCDLPMPSYTLFERMLRDFTPIERAQITRAADERFALARRTAAGVTLDRLACLKTADDLAYLKRTMDRTYGQ